MIIFLIVCDSEIDIVCGLCMGVDDYLIKDISMVYFVVCIGVLFRCFDVFD